jgi:RNA polymerase sigma-70 factor (ECF subfamily)
MDRTVIADLGDEIAPSSEGSFTDFYLREWRPVVGLGYVLTGNRWVAEELAQEAFLAAARQWDRVSRMDKPAGWVRRVVTNRSVSWFRRLGAERRALARIGNPCVRRDLDVDAEIAEVWAAVRRLPKRQAQVIALVYFDGTPVGEASEIMGCSRETARTHLKRGKKALAAILGVEEGHHA